MIDNFDDVAEFISGKKLTEDNFFYLTIVKRRKDNPDMKYGEINIDNIFIKSEEHLYDMKDRIIEICSQNNARAYFYINVRSKKKVALETLKSIVNSITSENYEIKNSYASNCGKHHADPDKHWVVDIDIEDFEVFDFTTLDHDIIPDIKKLQKYPENQREVVVIKTKNGFHIICKPFKLLEFKKKYPQVTVHKNSPTLLYIQ